MDGTQRIADRWSGVADALTRRVTVYFDGPTPEDEIVLAYAATSTEAWEFTSAALHAGLTVTVDGKVGPELRRLPCRSLWT
ncbi:hypothetical protein [Nocardia sp. bgisy134]|uniref:hypothetical protein n=1 Tax=unclassified Nocardia TaxID=2637762 RepID=UPI003D765CD3